MSRMPKSVALVYDRINKWGGAEQILLALHDLFPRAPLYTSVYSPGTAAWARVFPKVIPTFLQHLPFAVTRHEMYPWLTPMAFESLPFNQYEAVISVTSADAKGIITHPGTFHFCYCLTPTRYLWSHYDEYRSQLDPALEWITKPVFNYLKHWDVRAARRPDAYGAISRTVSDRISRYYGLASEVIYPPVDIDVYSAPVSPPGIKDFFLFVSRLVHYKRPEIVINVFNEVKLPLVVVGTGRLAGRLRRLAGPHIHFPGFISSSELVSYYQHCKATIFFHEEDFGLVPVESQASGRPVIALDRGGASETVLHGQTGLLLSDPHPDTLKSAVLDFDRYNFDPEAIRSHAAKFSRERFNNNFVKVFEKEWTRYKNTYTS